MKIAAVALLALVQSTAALAEEPRKIAFVDTGTHADVPDAWGKPMEVYVAMIKQLDAYLPAALEKAAAASPH